MNEPIVVDLNAPISYPKEIAEAIAKVMGADLYVQKRGKNTFHGYKYATVGDLLDKLQPLMAEAGLVIFQHETGAEFMANGSVMAVHYQFTLAHTSGAVWPEKPMHTGMSACLNTKGGFDDKAANKCHTAARKYFLLGLFQVPTGEDYREPAHDGDADGQDHAPPPRTNGNTQPFPLDAESIDGDQLKELMDLADEVGADKARFCKFLSVASFAAIPSSQYQKAKAALEAKRAAAAQ